MHQVEDFVESRIDTVTADDSYSVWRAWFALIVCDIQLLAAGIDIAIVTVLVHPIETAFRINDVGFAAINAIPVALGTAIAFYPAGLLADTFRRRDIIAAGAAIWTLGALLTARADSGAMLFVARLLAGIGVGVPWPATLSMLSDAFPRTRRAFAISVYLAAASIGAGVGLTICGALVAATQRNGTLHVGGMLFAPWQQCFVAAAAIGITVLALVLTLSEPPRKERSTRTAANLRSSLQISGQYFWRHWLLWTLLAIGYAIAWTSYYGVAAWGPTFGVRHYGIAGVSSIALLGTFLAGGSLLGSIGGGALGQRGINRGTPQILPRMFLAVTVLSCAFAAIFPFMPSWLFVVVGIGAVATALSALGALMIIGIVEATPNEVRAQVMGLFGVANFIPQILGATLVAFLASGVFAKVGGLVPAMAIVGATTGVLAVLLFAFAGGPYERARNEVRALDVPSQIGEV